MRPGRLRYRALDDAGLRLGGDVEPWRELLERDSKASGGGKRHKDIDDDKDKTNKRVDDISRTIESRRERRGAEGRGGGSGGAKPKKVFRRKLEDDPAKKQKGGLPGGTQFCLLWWSRRAPEDAVDTFGGSGPGGYLRRQGRGRVAVAGRETARGGGRRRRGPRGVFRRGRGQRDARRARPSGDLVRLGFATYVERATPAFRRCKSEQKRCSHGRDRVRARRRETRPRL